MKLTNIKRITKIFMIIMTIICILPLTSCRASTIGVERIGDSREETLGGASGGTVSGGSEGVEFNKEELNKIYGKQDDTYNKLAGKIIGIAQLLCYAAAVIVLLYKGVQFMYKSPEAKAELKKELVSYAVGAMILFAIGTIIKIIGSIAFKLF